MLNGFVKFCPKKSQHTHAVFQLRITVIAVLPRQLLFCQQIPFIAGMDKMIPPGFHADILKLMNQL